KVNDYEKLLQKVLNICNALSKEMDQKKEEITGMNAALELEDLVVNPIKNFSENRESMFKSCRTSTKMILVTYYDLNKLVEETLNNAEFESDKIQKIELEVLLKEVTAKCNALVQKLVPREKEPTQEPKGKSYNKKDNGRNNKGLVDNIEVLTEKEMLDHACELWIEKIKKFQGTAKWDRRKEDMKGPTEKMILSHTSEGWMRKVKEKLTKENDKDENEPNDIDDSNSKTIVNNRKKNGTINMWNRRKSDQTKNKNSGNAPVKTCETRDELDREVI
ncbi:20461_t:CDS:2, partial [Gigaspora margarita]